MTEADNRAVTRLLLVWCAAIFATTMMAWSCDNNDSATDCSRRELPQHYDRERGKWTCER